MSTRTPTIPIRARAARGFSMLEVLFALMILGLGLIAVAAIFPVAGTLQRETLDDIHSEQVAHSVSSLVYGRGFSSEYVQTINGTDVEAFPPEMFTDTPSTTGFPWLIQDRCYPAFIVDMINGGELADDFYLSRHFYWVPLVQRRTDDSWRVFVFLLRNERSASYPVVHDGLIANSDDDPDGEQNEMYRVPFVQQYEGIDANRTSGRTIQFDEADEFIPSLDLSPGSRFLDNHGVIHTAVLISGWTVTVAKPIEEGQEPDSIWYAPVSEKGRNPTRRILTFGSEVIR